MMCTTMDKYRTDSPIPGPASKVTKGSGRRWLFPVLGFLALVSGAGVGWLHYEGPSSISSILNGAYAEEVKPARGEQAEAGKQHTPVLTNAISRRAYDWDVRTCLGTIGVISDLLTTGRSFTSMSQRGPGDLDSAFTAAVAVRGANASESLSTLIAAPTNGVCNASYQTMAAFTESCEVVRDSAFGAFPDKVDLGGSVLGYGNGKGAYAFFLPVGNSGCAVLKTETLYRKD